MSGSEGYRPSYGYKDTGMGGLHLTYRAVKNRRVAVLQLLGADRQFPNLFDQGRRARAYPDAVRGFLARGRCCALLE